MSNGDDGALPPPPVRQRGDHRAPGGDGGVVPRLLPVGHHPAGAARRARRAEARPPPDPLDDVPGGLPPRPPPRQVRPRHRPRHGQVPPPRRLGHLRRPGAHGPAVQPAPPPDRLPRQLRLARLRGGGGALHRVPAVPAGHAAAGRHRRGHRRLRRQLLGRVPRAHRAARPLPQPAGQRQPGHRRGHGHQHPAPQPGRGHRRRRCTSSTTPTPRPTTSCLRQGPRLPHRRLHPGPGRASMDAYRTGRGSIRCGPGPRSTRARPPTRSSSPSCPTR